MSGYTTRIRGATPSLVSRLFTCPDHGVFDDTVTSPPPDAHPCPACGAPSALTMAAPAVHTQFVVTVTRGKSDPKPDHRSMDTRPIGEGQSFADWKKDRARVWEQDRKRRLKAALS